MQIENHLISLTKKLVKIPSITGDQTSNAIVLNLIKKYLSSNDIIVKEFKKNDYVSIAFLPKNQPKKFDVILHGHTDVVPASTNSDFKPYVKDGKIYGRGACDMKGGLAVIMLLFKNLINEKHRNVALYITSDEEKGGRNGTKYLFEKLKPAPRFFITAEGSEGENILKYKQKGALKLQITVKGKGGHAGYTWEGDNAIKKLFRAYTEIEILFPENLADKDHWYTTINLGTIHAGTVSNAIPDHAVAELNIRFADDWGTAEKIISAIEAIISKISGVSINVLGYTAMVINEKENPLIVKLNNLAKQQLGLHNDVYFKNHGTNDARFAAAAGIPAVGFGPVGRNCHAKDEYISIASMKDYYVIYKKFVDSF